MTERRIFAIDPGPADSGVVCFGTTADDRHPVSAENTSVAWCANESNAIVVARLRSSAGEDSTPPTKIVIEGVSSYGKAIGGSTIMTIFWLGRFFEAASRRGGLGEYPSIVLRRHVTAHLFGARLKSDPTADSMVSAAVAERFGGMGASLQSVKGKKAGPGPCSGFSEHIWQAMGLGIAFVEGAEVEKI